jgi:hypothetical protein
MVLKASPARILLSYPGDEEMEATLAAWPYTVKAAEGPGTPMTLGEVAAESGTPLREAAQSLVRLEDDHFLLWQPIENAYWLLTPDTPGAT